MNRLLALCLMLVVGLSFGCGPKKRKKQIRAEEGTAKLDEIMEKRRKRLISTAPTSDEPQDGSHPYLTWMSKIAGTVSRTEFKKVGVIAKGTKIARTADALATWLDGQKGFYFNSKMSPKDYWRDLSIASRASEGTSFAQDLAFEKIFFHVAESARRHDLFGPGRGPTDDRVTYFFTYVRLAFGFEAKTSLYQEEINKLCKDKLGKFCAEIPMELRPFQVMKPYYQSQIAAIDAFKSKFANSPYNGFLDRVRAWYETRIKRVPKWEEYPKLPGIRSTVAAPVAGNAALFLTKRGISLMGIDLRKADDPKEPWTADWSKQDEALTSRISQLIEDTRSSTVSNFNQSNILLVPEADVPVSFWVPVLKSTIVGEHAKEWPTVILVGRRRADGSNRRAGFTMTLLGADKEVAFKLKAPGAKKTSSCKAIAVAGRDALSASGFTPAVFHDGTKVHTGKLSPKGTLRSPVSMAPHGEGDQLEKWADNQTTSIVVAVRSSASYATALEALNGVALKCEEQECKKARTQPVFFAVCD